MAFKLFDKNGDKEISVAELKEVFHGVGDDEEHEALWKEIMQEVDKNNDNVISP